MAKLYLIRRNLELFSGPMTLVEMKEAYKRMQFGLQDEVSGHCGPWVTFENAEKIKRQYPEVARIVTEEMRQGWGITSAHGDKDLSEETTRIAVKSKRSVGLALAFLLIAVCAFIAAIYMASTTKVAPKTKDQNDTRVTPEDLQQFLDRGDELGFEAFVLKHQGEMALSLAKDAAGKSPWLPYLRLYAFTHDGEMAGVTLKDLRGPGLDAAPLDCSLKSWKKRWRNSTDSWDEVLGEQKLVHAHWARVIAWDPYWIKRRDHEGWLQGQNYYISCLRMADKALTEVAATDFAASGDKQRNRLGYHKIKARLSWLTSIAQGATPVRPEQLKGTGPLSTWTCYEAASNLAGLEACHSMAEGDKLKDYNDERYGWNLLRIAAGTHGPLPREMKGRLSGHEAKLNQEDHFTRFDYKPEVQLLKSMLGLGLPADKAVEKTQSEFPGIKMTH